MASSDQASCVCETCKSYLAPDETIHQGTDDADTPSTIPEDNTVCSVCQDLWKQSSPNLKSALEEACQVYGGMSANHISTSSITIGLPGELNLNYRSKQANVRSSMPFSVYLKDLKLFLVKEIQKLCEECHEQSPPPPILTVNSDDRTQEDEEQGFLSINLLCVPPKSSVARIRDKKKKKRQRWRPFVTQGGDPRVNLESRLQQQEGYQWYTMTDAERMGLSEYKQSEKVEPMEYRFAVYRKPIYLYGYYTKSRRDVSQSPFVVMREQSKEDGESESQENPDQEQEQEPPTKKRKKVAETLGVTSVEEQICNPIVEILGGISTQNNLSMQSQPGGPSKQDREEEPEGQAPASNVQYGMCKFHASGREDMDVRMMIRPNSNTVGRPFCVQLIDAKRALESEDQLNEMVDRINHTANKISEDLTKFKSDLWHGQNPLGVGVCPKKLRLAPANAYSNLQADTESKVKHYGCHCWSERILPKPSDNQEPITAQLFPELKLPLTIQQRTPLRVVHRRANLVRDRQILQLEAWRVDDHHFRLEMSTQAGTYVKEFVHGDLLRTQPSIASIMGCKANLLLLDCEGIELKD